MGLGENYNPDAKLKQKYTNDVLSQILSNSQEDLVSIHQAKVPDKQQIQHMIHSLGEKLKNKYQLKLQEAYKRKIGEKLREKML